MSPLHYLRDSVNNVMVVNTAIGRGKIHPTPPFTKEGANSVDPVRNSAMFMIKPGKKEITPTRLAIARAKRAAFNEIQIELKVSF